jgi:hypothetical protein
LICVHAHFSESGLVPFYFAFHHDVYLPASWCHFSLLCMPARSRVVILLYYREVQTKMMATSTRR